MTLQEIRTCADLKPAIYFLSDNMEKMTYGEFTGFKNTIEKRARELNIPLSVINKIAEEYQLRGEYAKKDI